MHNLNARRSIDASPKPKILRVVFVERLVDATCLARHLLGKVRLRKRFRIGRAVRWHKVKIHVLDGKRRGPVKSLRLHVGDAIRERKPMVGQVWLCENLGLSGP